MTVTDFYRISVNPCPLTDDDFLLFPYSDYLLIGFDKNGTLCIAVKSPTPSTTPLLQRTRLLSIECNTKITYPIDGKRVSTIVHIIRCFAEAEKEKEMFLEIIAAAIQKPCTDEEIMDVFRTLARFFADKSDFTDGELIGLYAELDAIVTFAPSLDMARYWQSKDRQKFDFSFTDRLKLEVKATTKVFRSHHFRHEQLVTEMYDIYVLSYMLRHDDEGVSLYDLITASKPLFEQNPQKMVRVNSVLKNVSESRLRDLKFSPEYTNDKRHFYSAGSIPRFPLETPEGVANAEYDCNLENISSISGEDFVAIVNRALSAGEGE